MAAGYALTACLALLVARRRSLPASALAPPLPSVTVLKPLHGAEPELYPCLRSFCDQEYRGDAGEAPVQVIFGVADRDDPAVEVVERLQRELPHRDLVLVVDSTRRGASAKVSNLINMMRAARHDCLVLADSDVLVPPGYLIRQVVPLLDPGVGIVTCAYRGLPRPGLWSLLGALFITDWFLPSVQVAALTGSRAFAFGASIALRRATLEAIGGFAAIADQLADDYRLGELTRRRGLATVLSEVVVDTWVDERSLAELVRHELRWLRTIRIVRPGGYSLSFITFCVPLALLSTLLAGGLRAALLLLGITFVARAAIHLLARRPGAPLSHLLAAPLADLLGFSLWAWGFVTRRVHWRDARFHVARDGSLIHAPGTQNHDTENRDASRTSCSDV
jgi:ceramide glucosyltransferase